MQSIEKCKPVDDYYVQMIKSGNKKVEDDFFNRYNGLLLSHVLKNSGSQAEHDDLYCEVMIVVFRKIKQGGLDDRTACLKTYIFAVGKRMWMNFLRKRKSNGGKGPFLSYDDKDFLKDTGMDFVDFLQDELDFQLNERIKKLEKILAMLSEQCRDKILDRYINGMSPADMAIKYGFETSVQATKSLSKCMGRARGFGDDL